MSWIPFLFSKILGNEYSNLSGDRGLFDRWIHGGSIQKEISRAIDPGPISGKTTYFLAQQDGETVIIAVDEAANLLGIKHPQAIDRKEPSHSGRPKPFALGYKAAKGAKIPSFSDMQGATEMIKGDLERLFDDAMAHHQNRTGRQQFSTTLPASGNYGANAWDKAAQKLMCGESLNGAVWGTQSGELQSKSFAPVPPPKSSRKPDKEAERAGAKQAGQAAKKGAEKKSPPMSHTKPPLKWAGAIAGIGMITHAVYSIVSNERSNKLNVTSSESPKRKSGEKDRWVKRIMSGSEAAVGTVLTYLSLRR